MIHFPGATKSEFYVGLKSSLAVVVCVSLIEAKKFLFIMVWRITISILLMGGSSDKLVNLSLVQLHQVLLPSYLGFIDYTGSSNLIENRDDHTTYTI